LHVNHQGWGRGDPSLPLGVGLGDRTYSIHLVVGEKRTSKGGIASRRPARLLTAPPVRLGGHYSLPTLRD
jgi:hypothetical protein